MKNKKIKNKMIIVCGGRGKRMGKITNNLPKPLIKVGKNPIIMNVVNVVLKLVILKILVILALEIRIKQQVLNKDLFGKFTNLRDLQYFYLLIEQTEAQSIQNGLYQMI